MDIDWAALVKVAVVSFVFAVGIVVVYSVGIIGTSMASASASADGAPAEGGGQGSGNRGLGITTAVVCFAGCAAAVLYGLWLIIPQFH